MAKPTALSADIYKYWQVDFGNRTVRAVLQDGQIFEEPLDPNLAAHDFHIARSIFDWERWWITSITTQGDVIITEGWNPTSPPRLDGRPSVYLDQNRWRTVADALHDPKRVQDPDERRAARDLIHLAADGGIVLPLSSGHMLETSGLHSKRRYEIGVAMAHLAAGWQIRHPIDLWRHEAELTIRGHFGLLDDAPVLHPIVTEPGALFGTDSDLRVDDSASDHAHLMAMVTMPNVILGTLIDPERLAKDDLTRWANHHARITAQIHAQGLPKAQRNALARRRYWNENIAFYRAPYRRLTKSADFPTFSNTELRRLLAAQPMVGLLSELFIRRFADHKATWVRNDLIDMLHLSGAAAYANYVCAEKRTGTQLREIQKSLDRRQTVFTNLHDLVTQLRADGARAESEQASDVRPPIE